jgi:hypothetical protein
LGFGCGSGFGLKAALGFGCGSGFGLKAPFYFTFVREQAGVCRWVNHDDLLTNQANP